MKLAVFVNRPILASVISIIIVLCGLVAAFNLPVEQFPHIAPPSIVVNATYPGASAETIAKNIAAQLEDKLNGTSNVIYMSSSSSGSGSVSVRLTFEVGTDPNYAVNEVLNRVQAAMPLLPAIVQELGVTVRKSSPDLLMVVSFYNDGGSFDRGYLSNYINRTIYTDFGIVPGVGQVTLFGLPYAMRVWMDVNKMNSLNVSANDIANAIKDQSRDYTIGRSSATPSASSLLTINMAGSEMYQTPKQFESIIIRESGTEILRLKDVARVELGANYYNTVPRAFFQNDGKYNEQDLTILQLFMDSSANQIEVRDRILAKLKKEAQNFPPGLKYFVTFDATQFVIASVNSVIKSLSDAFILVALIIFLFLHNWRASLIAIITIPVSIIGAFAALYLVGYTVNTLVLFALILAIGIVVDDAIVIVENIERLKVLNPHMKIKDVVNLAMDEVFGAVIAICLVLSVVFLPVMALSGLSGVLYRQFAVTIACTVVISAVAALTITPAISALLLKKPAKLGKFAIMFDRGVDKVANVYLYLAEKMIDYRRYSFGMLILIISSTIFIYKIIPLSFVPNEDQGYFFASVNLPSAASLDQTEKISNDISRKVYKIKGMQHVLAIIGWDILASGGSNTYASTIIGVLKNWDDRSDKNEDVDSIIAQVNKLNASYKNVLIRAFNRPPIGGLSTTGGIEFYLEYRSGGNINDLAEQATSLDKRLMKHKEIKNAYHLLDTSVEQVRVVPDVDMAKYYHVSIQSIYNTLQAVYNNDNINLTFLMQGIVWVILEGDYKYRASVRGIEDIYVKSDTNKMIPISQLVKISYYRSPQLVERFNDYLATKEVVEPNKGYSSGDVMKIIASEMQDLPIGFNYDWFGSSYQQQRSQKTSGLAFLFSFVMIYLVLCALYEMWRLPIVVLLGVPFALFGSGVMLFLRGQTNDLYFQISLIALLGLSAKNIILLIEFALQHFNAGFSAKESALYALKVRFRPIFMTSITFITGALPLMLATGAGANAEHSVGAGIIGGMLGSVIIGTLVAPSYFVIIMQNYKRKGSEKC